MTRRTIKTKTRPARKGDAALLELRMRLVALSQPDLELVGRLVDALVRSEAS